MRANVCVVAGLSLAAVLALSVTSGAEEKSFWSDAKVADSSYLTLSAAPVKLFKKNDIITVIITEAAKASGSGTLDRKRDLKHDFKINSWFELHRNANNHLKLNQDLVDEQGNKIVPEWSTNYQDEEKRSGDIERQDKIETRIAAVVRDVKPNGSLVIEASSVTVLNEERRTVTLSGMVRAEDIRPDNTVPSYSIAFSEIHYETKGPASDGARRGWLTAIFDFINPF
jgi:flagellar L-ring protein precursor FlgH